jgi:hypothetical protein
MTIDDIKVYREKEKSDNVRFELSSLNSNQSSNPGQYANAMQSSINNAVPGYFGSFSHRRAVSHGTPCSIVQIFESH